MIAVLEAAGVKVIALSPSRTNSAPWKRTKKPANAPNCFAQHRDEIDGIIVTLPNFGDERAIADTLRLADLHVPVLVQATPDTPGTMTIATAATASAARCRPATTCSSTAFRTR